MTRYYKEILHYVQRLSGDKNLAQDLTQETYAKAFKLKVHKSVENKRAYLYKIAKHLVFDESRKRKNFTEVIYKEEYSSTQEKDLTEELLLKNEEKKHLLHCIKNLPKRNKEAFYFFAIEGYSRKEIAAKMNISISAVEKSIQRATIKVQERLEEEGYSDEY